MYWKFKEAFIVCTLGNRDPKRISEWYNCIHFFLGRDMYCKFVGTPLPSMTIRIDGISMDECNFVFTSKSGKEVTEKIKSHFDVDIFRFIEKKAFWGGKILANESFRFVKFDQNFGKDFGKIV
jgi:hypothetical protein